ADVHEQFAVAGCNEDASLGLGEREPQPHRERGTHRTAEGEQVVAVIRDRGKLVGSSGETGDHEEVGGIADESGYGLIAVEGHGVGLLPESAASRPWRL